MPGLRLLHYLSVTFRRQSTLQSQNLTSLLNARQIVILRYASDNSVPRRGCALKELGIINNGAVLCIGGKVVSVGTTKDALRDSWIRKHRKELTEIDCAGKVV